MQILYNNFSVTRMLNLCNEAFNDSVVRACERLSDIFKQKD